MSFLSDLFMFRVLPASHEACTVAHLRVQYTLSAIIALHIFQGPHGILQSLHRQSCTTRHERSEPNASHLLDTCLY